MQASTAIPDRSLIERARHGDRAAFDLLVGPRVDRLYAAARLMLRAPDGAEDAVQEALVRAWRGLPTLRDPAAFEAWLRQLLVRACSDEERRRRRWHIEVALGELDPGADDRRLHGLDDQDEIERAFRRLSEAHRVVLVLQHVLGLSGPDAAEVLGIPLGTVKSRTHFALGAMRAAMQAEARRPKALGTAESVS